MVLDMRGIDMEPETVRVITFWTLSVETVTVAHWRSGKEEVVVMLASPDTPVPDSTFVTYKPKVGHALPDGQCQIPGSLQPGPPPLFPVAVRCTRLRCVVPSAGG